jgi:site-specific DNA-methyltransferase (cytosine-N4-specific)
MATRPSHHQHYAAFPIDLPLRCIAAGCPPGGLALDPFSGAGTTILAARQLGREAIRIDINPAYHHLTQQRLSHQLEPDGSPGEPDDSQPVAEGPPGSSSAGARRVRGDGQEPGP